MALFKHKDGGLEERELALLMSCVAIDYVRLVINALCSPNSKGRNLGKLTWFQVLKSNSGQAVVGRIMAPKRCPYPQ